MRDSRSEILASLITLHDAAQTGGNTIELRMDRSSLDPYLGFGSVRWPHGRAKACHSKYSPQVEDRKHGFVNRRARSLITLKPHPLLGARS